MGGLPQMRRSREALRVVDRTENADSSGRHLRKCEDYRERGSVPCKQQQS